MRFRGPRRCFQCLIVATDERFFLFAAPALDTALASDGIFQPLEICRPYQFDWPARMGIAGITSGLMVSNPPVKPFTRKADMVRMVATSQHIDEDIHVSSPFDRLRVRKLLVAPPIAPAPAAFGLVAADRHRHQDRK